MTTRQELLVAEAVAGTTRLQRLRALGPLARRKPLGAICLLILVAVWALALLAPVIAPTGFNEPLHGPTLQPLSWTYPFGTDQLGRDVLSRILWAGRADLVVSLAASAIGVSAAVLFGTISAYLGGFVDLVMQRIVDAIQAMPGIIVLMVLVAVVGRDIWLSMLGIVVLTVPVGLRILRANVLQLRALPYVEAATSIGADTPRVLVRHILPNLMPVLIVLVTFALGTNLLILSALAFLGLLEPGAPSWGTMLQHGSIRFMLEAPWLALVPGGAITLVVFSYNMLGDALRDVLDPHLRGA